MVSLKRATVAMFGVLIMASGPAAAAEGVPTHPPSMVEAQAQSAPTEPALELFGYDGGFFLRTADEQYLLRFNARFDGRFTYLNRADEQPEVAFSVPRARLVLSGNVFTKALTFRFQTDFGRGTAGLKDFFADYAFIPDGLHLRIGQFKLPLWRPQINSSMVFQFVERSISNGSLGAGRDIGVVVHDNYEKSPRFEYALAVFNGTSEVSHFSGTVIYDPFSGGCDIDEGGFSNIPKQLQPGLALRLGYNHDGIKGYDLVDFKGGPPRFSVGAASKVNFGTPAGKQTDEDEGASLNLYGDYLVKAYGFTTTGGITTMFEQTGPKASDLSYHAMGFHVQAGYLIVDRLQPAVRYARVHTQAEGTVHELSAALAVFFFRHNVEWRSDISAIHSDQTTASQWDQRMRTELQFAF